MGSDTPVGQEVFGNDLGFWVGAQSKTPSAAATTKAQNSRLATRNPALAPAPGFFFAVASRALDSGGMTLSPLGDSAIVVAFGDAPDESALPRVRALVSALGHFPPPGVVEVVPAFTTVTVFYDPARIAGYAELCAEIEVRAGRADATLATQEARVVEIPVCYGGEPGPDLAAVAAHCGLTAERVVALHSGADYVVRVVGFAPGFGYLGGLPKEIHAPRRATPRTRVPAGSVGIGGAQTGVYPLATPGGWNLIGRTPLRLFDATRDEPALLRAGDHVKFRAVSPTEFETIASQDRHSLADRPWRTKSDGAEADHGQLFDDNGPAITVVRAGMLTTVQDLGRRGHRAAGVPLSGAMDALALRVANLLVGNAENDAGLEFSIVGPELVFSAETVVAVSGGDFGALPRWQPVHMAAGERVNFGAARSGGRGYLAIAGGFRVEAVLGSRSTYLPAALGGRDGRALRDGDVLRAPGLARQVAGRWHIDERILPDYGAAPTLRIVRGAQADEFDGTLCSAEFKVTPQSDRMGVRLAGPALVRARAGDLSSAPVAPGTIQVPPDGQLIVLMADAQTIGGYPQIAHVIDVDLPLVAQLRAGDRVRFCEVTLAVAHELAHARERALAMLREGLAQKFR